MGWLIEKERGKAWTRVIVDGELDLYSAPAFAKEMLALIEAGEKAMEFDAGTLTYLDSTGVGAIIRIVKSAKGRGMGLRWTGIGGMPRRVLALTNILPLLGESKAGT
jgi:anti-anti-sigma factor